MSKHDIDKAYISPIDHFLYKFDQEHVETASQKKEIKKHKRIALLRDNPEAAKREDEIWTEF